MAVAADIGVRGFSCDVSRAEDLTRLIDAVEGDVGPIDIFVSNAGISLGQPDHAASASDDDWMRNWTIHVLSHVWAARALLPGMLARGSGCFVQIASAAGLLNQIGDAAYSASKHAAVSFAESLAIEHGDAGIRVALVCPQYVATRLLGLGEADAARHETLLAPSQVAEAVLAGLREDRFLVLPHPQVADYMRRRTDDPDAWIAAMRKLKARASGARPDEFYRFV
jgi:NAD(P)-dependent dehydrogenase (short-subunit alcohol dehydrogenase family)